MEPDEAVKILEWHRDGVVLESYQGKKLDVQSRREVLLDAIVAVVLSDRVYAEDE